VELEQVAKADGKEEEGKEEEGVNVLRKRGREQL
jgi:hypothetical protein